MTTKYQGKAVSDLLGEVNNGLYMSYNRYGGGYAASLVSDTDVTAHDHIFTTDHDRNYLGLLLMEQLGIPYATGDSPVDAVTALLGQNIDYDDGEFGYRYDAFREIMSAGVYAHRGAIEDGSLTKKHLKEIHLQYYPDQDAPEP